MLLITLIVIETHTFDNVQLQMHTQNTFSKLLLHTRDFLTYKLGGKCSLVNGVFPPEIIPFSKSLVLELKKLLLNK